LKVQLEAVLRALQVEPFDAPADVACGVLCARLERTSQPIGAHDLLIAAHAIALNCTVVTDNTREFGRVDALMYENWLRDPA
jgi:tRNA(fMet)-specific endonuclease VapC